MNDDYLDDQFERGFKDQKKLDKAYDQAAKFDSKQLDQYIKDNFVEFTRRTNYPKLGYIIQKLNDLGIPALLNGESSHAPILLVDKTMIDEAQEILEEKMAGMTLDDVDDEDIMFDGYESIVPESLLEEDDPGRYASRKANDQAGHGPFVPEYVGDMENEIMVQLNMITDSMDTLFAYGDNNNKITVLKTIKSNLSECVVALNKLGILKGTNNE